MTTSWHDLETVARTIYGESRGEPREGKHAVAWVIVNRSRLPGYGGPTLYGVCRKPWQFSCWNADDPMLPKLLAASVEKLGNCILAAVEVIAGKVPDPTGGATHYLNEAVTRKIRGGSLPLWADETKITTRIGLHTFFRLE